MDGMKAGGSELGWDVVGGRERVAVARAAATQIANIRQIFLNSSVATQPFEHYLALFLALPADQEISNLITVTAKHQSNGDSRARDGMVGFVKQGTHTWWSSGEQWRQSAPLKENVTFV